MRIPALCTCSSVVWQCLHTLKLVLHAEGLGMLDMRHLSLWIQDYKLPFNKYLCV